MGEHYHHAFIGINLDYLLHNLHAIDEFSEGKVLAILKKNAYGHGAIIIAKALETKVDYFGVIYPQEGVALREAGIKTPILVLGATLESDISDCINHGLQFALLSNNHLDTCKAVAKKMEKRATVHLKVDTGMGRIGTSWKNCSSFMEAAAKAPEIIIEGVFSHLACADVPDNNFSNTQVERFKSAVAAFPERAFGKPLFHLAASGGILHYPSSHFDMIRPGHILYGLYPDKNADRKLDLRPVLSLHAKVLFSKKVLAGEYVGYGNKFQASSDTWISTIGIGYGDGYPRGLTAKGRVLVRGKSFPIVSSVCMDQLMIDTKDICLSPGEKVVLIGKQGNHEITTEEIADQLGTVPDDIVSNLNLNLPKTITQYESC